MSYERSDKGDLPSERTIWIMPAIGTVALWVLPLLTALKSTSIWLGGWALVVDTIVAFKAGYTSPLQSVMFGRSNSPTQARRPESNLDYRNWPWTLAIFAGFVIVYVLSVSERLPAWSSIVVSLFPLIGSFTAGQLYRRRSIELGRPPRWHWIYK